MLTHKHYISFQNIVNVYNKIYNQISKQSIFIKIADVFCLLFTFISKYVNLVSDIIDDAKKI